jgi:hypothetical protein
MPEVIEATPQQTQQLLDRIEEAKPPQLQVLQRQAQLPAALNPGALLQLAVERGDSIEVLTKLMDLKDRYDAKMALEAFNTAFAAFKAANVQVLRNKLITDGPLKGKKHAALSDVCDAATEAMSKHGLSTSWRVVQDDKDWIKVACRVRHSGGHSEETEFGGPIDAGPGRNAIQARKSSVTYLERITMLLALGLAEYDADNDGAGDGEKLGAEAALMARLIGEAQQTTTDAEAAAHWKAHSKELLTWPYAYEKYKQAVAAHRTAMKQKATA